MSWLRRIWAKSKRWISSLRNHPSSFVMTPVYSSRVYLPTKSVAKKIGTTITETEIGSDVTDTAPKIFAVFTWNQRTNTCKDLVNCIYFLLFFFKTDSGIWYSFFGEKYGTFFLAETLNSNCRIGSKQNQKGFYLRLFWSLDLKKERKWLFPYIHTCIFC